MLPQERGMEIYIPMKALFPSLFSLVVWAEKAGWLVCYLLACLCFGGFKFVGFLDVLFSSFLLLFCFVLLFSGMEGEEERKEEERKGGREEEEEEEEERKRGREFFFFGHSSGLWSGFDRIKDETSWKKGYYQPERPLQEVHALLLNMPAHIWSPRSFYCFCDCCSCFVIIVLEIREGEIREREIWEIAEQGNAKKKKLVAQYKDRTCDLGVISTTL